MIEINSEIELQTAKERRNYLYEIADFRTLTQSESNELAMTEDEIEYFIENA